MVLRTVLVYLLLLLVIRVMGKRQIGELQASEFIITVLLSEIAAAPISNRSLSIWDAVVPVLVLLAMELLISAALLRSNLLKRLFYGSPSVVVCRGKIDLSEMRRNRIEIDELLSELRQQGISDITDVNYAILEENGRLSVFPYAEKAPLTPGDMKIPKEESGIAHACVLDGRILPENLKRAGWSKDRLMKELASRGLLLKEVFVLTVDDAGGVVCVRKQDG